MELLKRLITEINQSIKISIVSVSGTNIGRLVYPSCTTGMSREPSKPFDLEVALSQAMKVFWARGYGAASLSELLSQMGIEKSLYDTLSNMRSLFLKALDHDA